MRRHIALISTGFFLLLGGCRQQTAELTPADVAAVKANYTDWANSAISKRDTVAANKLVTEDLWYSPANRSPYVGRNATVGIIPTLPADIRQSWNVEEVVGSGDHAYSRASVTETFTSDAGKKVTGHEVCASLHRRDANGDWKFSRVICHSVDTTALILPSRS
jgi:ketosteroid isomerase-like protein